MPAEATTLAIPVAVADVAARTSRTVDVAVDSAVADPLPQDDRASVVVRRRPGAAGDGDPDPDAAAAAVPPPPAGAPAATRRPPRRPAKALALRGQAEPRAAAHEQVRRERRGRLRAGGVLGVGYARTVRDRRAHLAAEGREGEPGREPHGAVAPGQHEGAAPRRPRGTAPLAQAQAERRRHGPRARRRREGRDPARVRVPGAHCCAQPTGNIGGEARVLRGHEPHPDRRDV